jgi:ribosome-associated protein
LNSKEKALLCAGIARDKKAHDLVIIKVQELSSFADYFIICSGASTRQVQAIAEHVEAGMKEKGFRPLGVEGMRTGRWVLLDYADVIMHVFHETEREFYDLERLWSECPRLDPDAVHGKP